MLRTPFFGPLWARLCRNLGCRASSSGNQDLALSYFRRAEQREPKYCYNSLLVAWCLCQQRNYEAALEKLDEMLREGCTWPAAQAYRALALSEVGRLQEAIDELRRARRKGFKDTIPMECVGLSLCALGLTLLALTIAARLVRGRA
jgi:pentatricopeptide repeat protein